MAGKQPTKAKDAKAPGKKRPAAARVDHRVEKFRRGVLEHGNAARAYREAGYKAGPGARNNAYLLMTKDDTQEWLAVERQKRLAAMDVRVDDVFKRYKAIAFADVAQITTHEIAACRYCHGADHLYQWRTVREWQEASADEAGKRKRVGFTDPEDNPLPCGGGFGYSTKAPPHPDCPECDGRGIGIIAFKDTRLMTDDERAIFAGVEQTQHGMKYKLNDQVAALSQLAEKIEFFKDRDTANANALANALQEISQRGSRMPLRKDDVDEGTGE